MLNEESGRLWGSWGDENGEDEEGEKDRGAKKGGVSPPGGVPRQRSPWPTMLHFQRTGPF